MSDMLIPPDPFARIDTRCDRVLESLPMTTNFAQIIRQILAASAYTSEQKLATALDVTQPTVHRLKNGTTAEPGYELGCRILKLHKRLPKK